MKARAFLGLHEPGNPVVLFNVWDAGSAAVVAKAGAKAIGTSSWAVAAANGLEDGERIASDVAIANLERIVGATELPVSVDLESGYGNDPEAVAQSVVWVVGVGAVGCNLEDSFPENGQMRETADQIVRLRYARKAADTANFGFFINARCDVFLQRPPEQHDDALLEEAIARGHAYARAGADGFFVPGLQNLGLIAELAKAVALPVNVMADDTWPPPLTIAEHGVARISYGPHPYQLAMKALEEAARAASGSQIAGTHRSLDSAKREVA